MIYSKTDVYRIQIGDTEDYPYHVKMRKRGWLKEWEFKSLHETVDKAKRAIVEYKNSEKNLPPVGTIILYYGETEIIVDKLKGDV